MKIKEIQAGVKVSKNYNSYSVNLVADIEENEIPETVGGILIEKSLEIVSKKMNGIKEEVIEKENSEIEIGAAWFHKKSSDFLSVKFSKDGSWENVKISDLEKTDDGFKQKINNEVLIFRRISEEKRRNDKMPVFRIYTEVDNERT